jgi:hypothetical protein
MKMKTLLCALTVACALAAGKAIASSSMLLNISGALKIQNTDGDYQGTVFNDTFDEKTVFIIISNALANASASSGGAIASTNLPKGAYIVYNPQASDAFILNTNVETGFTQTVYGKFYAEYKVGKTNVVDVPLSGLDTNGNYYSFMELDTTIYYGDTNGLYTSGGSSITNSPLDLGFWNYHDVLYYGVTSYKLNKAGSGSSTSTSKALLYIHDYPYDYGDPNGNDYDNSLAYGYDFYPLSDNNDYALEIGGILTANLTIKTNSISSGSFSLNGTGNFQINNAAVPAVVTSGHASFTGYKP